MSAGRLIDRFAIAHRLHQAIDDRVEILLGGRVVRDDDFIGNIEQAEYDRRDQTGPVLAGRTVIDGRRRTFGERA